MNCLVINISHDDVVWSCDSRHVQFPNSYHARMVDVCYYSSTTYSRYYPGINTGVGTKDVKMAK